MDNQLSPWMIDKITRGQAVLFLGAGASYEGEIDGAKVSISGDELRDRLSDQFLGGEQKDISLVQVADYAKYQAGLNEVQVFVKNQFVSLRLWCQSTI